MNQQRPSQLSEMERYLQLMSRQELEEYALLTVSVLERVRLRLNGMRHALVVSGEKVPDLMRGLQSIEKLVAVTIDI